MFRLTSPVKMSGKRPRSPSPMIPAPDVFRSGKIQDRSSTFIGLYSPTRSAKSLQADPEISSASHRIVAWRTPSSQTVLSSHKRIFDTGHDDDGEKYAGKKLENLLSNLDVTGAVVIARWYGGVLLGPVRFTHIENCAREAIIGWRHAQGRISAVIKKPKPAGQAEEDQDKLINTLEQRDQSIVVLRALLADKMGKADKPATRTNPSQSSPKKLDYNSLPFETLKQLEKARDATIAYVLKQIDKIEEENSMSNQPTRDLSDVAAEELHEVHRKANVVPASKDHD